MGICNNKVSFLCVGTQKAGTTWLAKVLGSHEEVFIPKKKELHFFDRDHDKGYNFYHRHFRKDKALLWGEITPSYLNTPGVAERIYLYNNNMKIIIILRDPTDRAISHYRHLIRNAKKFLRNNTKKDIAEFILNNPFIDVFQADLNGIRTRGYYDTHIAEYRKYFDENNLYVDSYDNLCNEPGKVIDNICKFLNIDLFDTYPECFGRKFNVSKAKYSVSTIELEYVKEHYLNRL